MRTLQELGLKSWSAWEAAIAKARAGDVSGIGRAGKALQAEIARRAGKIVHEDAIELLRAGQEEIREGFNAVASLTARLTP